ncbi:tetratricopeptide repeat protein [Marinifilum sp.]|uniref:tetratricopeptide repeat protein n=1 Tax=Marinifilum sp. TaxID=2033137 RepID=UPI003BAAB633
MKVGRKLLMTILLGSSVFLGVPLHARNIKSIKKDKLQKEVKLTEQQRLEFDYAFAEATKAILLGEIEKGISMYVSCLKIDPSSAVVRYELANVYLSKENYNSALELSRGAVAQQPRNLWYQIQLANIYQQKGMIDHACKVYGELIEMYPDRLDFFYLQAALFASVEKFEEAVEVYNRLEKKVGIQESVSLEKERLYLKMGDKKSAYSEVQMLIKKYPYRADFYGVLADLYLADNEEEKAFKQYQEILKIDPDNGLVHFYLADFYRKKGEIDKAKESLLIAFGQEEVQADQKIQYLIAMLMAPDQPELSDDYLRSLLDILVKIHPGHVRVHALYADFLRKRKDNEGAKHHLQKVLEDDKSNYVVWEELLLIHNELLDFDSMLKLSSEALAYFPSQPLLYIFKGVAEAQKNDFNTAISTFEKGIIYVGDNVRLRIQFKSYMGDAYYQTGEFQKAFKSYDEVLLYDPENVIILNNYSYYLSVRGEHLEKAKEMSLKCIELEPENPTYLDTHAWVLYRLGEYNEAKKIMEKALKFGGDDSAVQVEHYGDILYRLGEDDKALEEWKKALELGEGSEYLAEKVKTGSIPEEEKDEE